MAQKNGVFSNRIGLKYTPLYGRLGGFVAKFCIIFDYFLHKIAPASRPICGAIGFQNFFIFSFTSFYQFLDSLNRGETPNF